MECRECKYAAKSEYKHRIWCMKHRKNVMSTYSKCPDATNLTATKLPGCPGGLCGTCSLLEWPTCEPIRRAGGAVTIIPLAMDRAKAGLLNTERTHEGRNAN